MNIITKAGLPLLSEIVPDEIMQALGVIAQNWKADRWTVGFIANELRRRVDADLLPVSAEDIYAWVAQGLNQEIEPRTVRYYAALEAFYAPEIRSKYSELPFSHFALAKSYGDAWERVLSLANEQRNRTGRTPSAAWVGAAMGGMILHGDYQALSGDVVDLSTEGDYIPVGSTGSYPLREGITVSAVVELFRKALTAIQDLLEKSPFAPEKREKLQGLLYEIERTLRDM